MRDRSSAEYLPWSVAGVLLVVLFVVLFWFLRPDQSPAQQLAQKATRVDLVSRMQVALASSSEAQRSAVLATSDEDSVAFAAQARAALAEVEAARAELVPLLAAGGRESARARLDQFTAEYARLRRLDEEILALAVRNTNVKAYALAYGPASEAVGALDGALAGLAARRAAGPEAHAVLQAASDARLAAWRMQALLPPHIAEERAEAMDRLELSMTAEERRAGEALGRLSARPSTAGDPDLAAARGSLATFLELKRRILALSRENTNVASLALSLGQQRKAMAACAEALAALQKDLLEEPIAGVAYGRAPNPTR
jgi:hypothetical protein